MNIKLHYLYRDGANYKNHHTEVFSNNYNQSLDEVRNKLSVLLIDGLWFSAAKWNLKDLHFTNWDLEVDHSWHEFNCLELTQDAPTMTDITDFIDSICA